jgi:hypothetical protein
LKVERTSFSPWLCHYVWHLYQQTCRHVRSSSSTWM